ncbi:MAG: rhodanese-like domain-containing protein [bacterium]
MKSVFLFMTALFVFSCTETENESSSTAENAAQKSVDKTEIQNVSADSASALIQQQTDNPDFIILDVRTAVEFQSGHIENAICVDFKSADFKQKLAELDKNKTYLLHCRSGNRSGQALKVFQELGFKKIIHINRGMLDWQASGLPVVKEK